MVLSNTDIKKELVEKRKAERVPWAGDDVFSVEPLEDEQIQPASIDLTLGNEWIEFEAATIDEARPTFPGSERKETLSLEEVMGRTGNKIKADSYVLQPNTVVLGVTKENISLPSNIAGEVAGRSSIGRVGIIPHTAGWIDPGFEGDITLEIVNFHQNPIEIESGDRIAQLTLKYTNRPADPSYGDKTSAKYQGQSGVTESRIEEEK